MKRGLIRVLVEGDAVIRQMIMLDDVPQHLAKALFRALRAAFLEKGVQRNGPSRLPSAVLARELVDTALERFSEAKIVAVER